jgi:hypothetical protein
LIDTTASITARSHRDVTQDINVLALVKGQERYIFLYDDAHRAEALRTLGRFASNPELSFSWYDAAVLSQRIRQNAQAAEREATSKPRFQLPLATDGTDEA